MVSKYFKLDIVQYRQRFIGDALKKERKTKKLPVMSEWSWDLGIVAFGKMDK